MSSFNIYSGIRGFLLVAVCLAIVNISIGEQKICGTGLRQTMEMLCPNGIGGYKIKRSSLNLDGDISSENTEEDFNFGLSLDMLPFLTSSENTGLAKIRRRRHGIVHECCYKACKLSEMLAYCQV